MLHVHFEDGTIVPECDLQKRIVDQEFVRSDIAVLPPQGFYGFKGQYSKMSIVWLESISRERKIHIRHALSPEGEWPVPMSSYRADGYSETEGIVFEVSRLACFLLSHVAIQYRCTTFSITHTFVTAVYSTRL